VDNKIAKEEAGNSSQPLCMLIYSISNNPAIDFK